MKCEIVTGNMPQLWEDLLSQLHEKEYPSESIRHYREAMGRVDRYMRENQILEYTEAVGETYLATHGGRISSGRQFYMSFYVRRLNDILNKRPYVVVHTRKKQKDLKHFSGVFERFDEMLCKQSIQMEKERNLNYWTIRKFSLLYSYYAIIDTTDYLADQLFVKNEVRVWFGQEYICPDGPYCVIFCKCRKRDTGAFESAMNELPRKMLLRGHTDYIQFCEGLKNKIAAAWKSGGELQHEEARPSA